MKKIMLPILFAMLTFTFSTFAQQIESFDAATLDSLWQTNVEAAPSYLRVNNDSTDKVEGAASLHAYTMIGSLNDWGSFSQYIYALGDSATPLDWSASDTLSIWIKVTQAPAHPEYMVFRIQIADRPTPTAPIEQYIYENASILDNVHDWVQLKVPFKEITSDGTYIPDSTGFVIAPNSWGGFTYNDRKLNTDKIVQFQLGMIVSGYTAGTHLPADSIEVNFDNFERLGNKSVPAIIFNGITTPKSLELFTWGQSSVETVEKAGPDPKLNAIKWTQGDEWGSGWTGFGYNIDPNFTLGGAWQQDSLQFMMKTDSGVDTIRVQFEGGTGKVGYKIKPIDDNAWHMYKAPLRDFTLVDGTTGFDSSKVGVFQVMAEANAKVGSVVYFSNMWTGHPVFDVIAPDAPQGVLATAGTFSNLITWSDDANETGETYNVYFSKSPITDITSPDVSTAAQGIAKGTQSYNHVLRAPKTDQSVTYYYAVTCVDQSGNISQLSANTAPLTNTAKGYAVIEPTTINFQADGDLSEWSSVKPFRMFPSDGSGSIVTNTKIDNDDDCSANAYIAIDNDNLYIAVDVNDDVVYSEPALSSWLNDNVDLFIGLYDLKGAPHSSFKRGATPDYHIRMAKDRLLLDGINPGDSVLVPGENYYWQEQFPTGYRIEAKIPLATLAARGKDTLFVPKKGMTIPIDFEVSDNDGNPASDPTREGQLDYSKDAEGNSYSSPNVWTYTWVGDWVTAVNDKPNTVISYKLEQNYPNPFNPTTQISYTLEKSGNVTLKVYDILGRVVANLVNSNQIAGTHTINFNASNLASGIYFYKLETGSFQSVKKMMLLK